MVPLTNPKRVRRLSISPDGTEVVVGQKASGRHRALSRWQLPDFTRLPDPDPCPLSVDQDVCNLLVHGGNGLVAVAGLAEKHLSLIDLDAGSATTPVSGKVASVALSGHVLAVTGTDVRVIDWTTGELIWQPDRPDRQDVDSPAPVIALHPSGESFAIGGWGNTVVELRSLTTDGVTARLAGSSSALRWLGFSPDGRYLLAITPMTGAVTVWRAGETKPHRPDVFGSMDYIVAAFHPDGEHCAMGMWSGYLGIYQLSDGAEVEIKAAHRSDLNALGFTPDGKTLLTGGDDGKLLAWPVLD
ncbi:WD40 repeat domain-containing protein [Actinoplanes sp. CA-131856]